MYVFQNENCWLLPALVSKRIFFPFWLEKSYFIATRKLPVNLKKSVTYFRPKLAVNCVTNSSAGTHILHRKKRRFLKIERFETGYETRAELVNNSINALTV